MTRPVPEGHLLGLIGKIPVENVAVALCGQLRNRRTQANTLFHCGEYFLCKSEVHVTESPLTVERIAERVGITRETASRALRTLKRKGCVAERSRSGQDGAIYEVDPTRVPGVEDYLQDDPPEIQVSVSSGE